MVNDNLIFNLKNSIMKKFLFIAALFTASLLVSCKDHKVAASDVPPAVTASFTAKYPGASGVEWITEKKNDKTIYEAQFKLNDKKIDAEFDADGTFIGED
jgi:hypothetical protein